MALLNPVYAFVVPFLFLVTVPLALLAGITTTLAFAVLIFRVLIVYLDVALSLIPQSLASIKFHTSYVSHEARLPATFNSSAVSSNEDSSTASSINQQPLFQRRRRRRPSSSISILSSAGSTTPVGEFGLGLMPSVGPERDFEGIGGWRSGDDDDVWTTINSRMELPDRGFGRHHHRSSSSGGVTTPGDGGVLMMKTRRRSPESRTAGLSSPNSSRARTPSASRLHSLTTIGQSDGYFPLTMSPKASKKMFA
ncbi:hypothetical protein QQS21_006503 [Conoideocrella luteorostrata]|uniref:Uncharacterized protein n=1 Tax=Conoideocrella luteorostrata TaxID=1105319 RepID=A0AAJ0FXY7_9HYPO|nr:hypothetical protein QQS21_006503 [Conoideocrella luteorostrata]